MSRHKSVEDFHIRTLEVFGFQNALVALHLPFSRDVKSISFSDCHPTDENDWISKTSFHIEPDDLKLISILVRRGDEHAKVLRGVMASCLINAPRYFYQELDRYRVGCECLGSESTMHIQGKGLSEDDLVEMKENLTEGTMQKRVWMFSYQTLRRIYFQRRDHRLPQWRKFCGWIKTLPFANEFIICERDTNFD